MGPRVSAFIQVYHFDGSRNSPAMLGSPQIRLIGIVELVLHYFVEFLAEERQACETARVFFVESSHQNDVRYRCDVSGPPAFAGAATASATCCVRGSAPRPSRIPRGVPGDPAPAPSPVAASERGRVVVTAVLMGAWTTSPGRSNARPTQLAMNGSGDIRDGAMCRRHVSPVPLPALPAPASGAPPSAGGR